MKMEGIEREDGGFLPFCSNQRMELAKITLKPHEMYAPNSNDRFEPLKNAHAQPYLILMTNILD